MKAKKSRQEASKPQIQRFCKECGTIIEGFDNSYFNKYNFVCGDCIKKREKSQ